VQFQEAKGMTTMNNYVHGYSEREAERLYDQANSVRELLHHDTVYLASCRVLEAGCGVGAQTVTLARNSPSAQFVSVDISLDSLEKARALADSKGLSNVQFRHADIFALPFEEENFDHVFVCHVLEHLQDPVGALSALRNVLKKGGSITVIEGDHGSCYFHPESDKALHAWNCLIQVQARLGGNSLIGRQVFPLLKQAGFRDIRVSPRMVYIDQSKPGLMDSFVKKTIIPMVEGAKARALEIGFTNKTSWDKGIRDLHKVAESEDGTFCYTFFKAVGVK
jgi:ubiquinone/menaquinone biosynthesis C-methylase UbiE